jgi:hypothetical protein
MASISSVGRRTAAAALLALALLAGGAAAQTTADCDRSVKHCQSCRYQFFRGTTTKVGRARSAAPGARHRPGI